MTMSALRPRVAGCAAIGSLATYRSLIDSDRFTQPPSTFVWNVLANYDLPEAAAAIAPRPLLVAGPVDAAHKPLPVSSLQQTYKATTSAFAASAASRNLVLTADPSDILKWLRSDTEK